MGFKVYTNTELKSFKIAFEMRLINYW